MSPCDEVETRVMKRDLLDHLAFYYQADRKQLHLTLVRKENA